MVQAQAVGRRLAHRGRDGAEWPAGRDLVLGARGSRLFIDLQEHGPIAFDGAIDNRREIAQHLGRRDAAALGPPEDAQLLYELVATRGPEGLALVAGIFAAALWLGSERRLLLVRDRIGYAPLYLTRAGERIAFASEYKALLGLDDVAARPNRGALQTLHSSGSVEPGATCLEGIYPVAPGSCLEIRPGRLSSTRYWTAAAPLEGADSDHLARLRSAFLDTLRRQTASYGRVGISLSGGLDSALVAAGVRTVAGGREVHTFTAAYGADDVDLAGAERVARALGTRHHPLVLDPADLRALLPWIAWHMEEPIGREDVALLFLAAREAASRVDLLLTGFGFDRLFGGRRRHRLAQLAIRYPALRGPLGELYDYVSRSVPPRSLAGRALKAVCFRGTDHPAAAIAGAAPPAPFAGFPREGPEPLGQLLRHAFLMLPGDSPVERLYAGAGVRMNAQPTDPAFLGAAFALPDRLRIRGGRTKVGLRKACSSLLPCVPPEAGGRRDPPLCRPAIADALQGMAVELLSPGAVRERGLFDPAYVADLLRRASVRSHAPERLRRLWSLLLIELWSHTYLDRRGEPPEGVLPSVRRLEPLSRPEHSPTPTPSRQ